MDDDLHENDENSLWGGMGLTASAVADFSRIGDHGQCLWQPADTTSRAIMA